MKLRSLRKKLKYKWYRINAIVVLISFTVICGLSISYATIQSNLSIFGDVVIIPRNSIRIVNLETIWDETNNCAMEMFNPRHTSNTITIGVTLPNLNCVIEYEITVENREGDRVLESIDFLNSNDNIIFEFVDGRVYRYFESESTTTFIVRFRYNPNLTTLPNNTSTSATITFEFIDYVPMNVVINYSTQDPTSQNVTATIFFDQDEVTILNNNGSNQYIFQENGTFTWEFENKYRRTGQATATVTWISSTYTIIYNANNGIGTMESTTCTFDQDCTLRVNTFTRPGSPELHFGGWALSSTGGAVHQNGVIVRNITTPPNTTITLFAVWQATPRVTYDPQGGRVSPASNSVSSSGPGAGTIASSNWNNIVVSRPGYNFLGWFTQPNGGGSRVSCCTGGTVFTRSSIIYAHWQPIQNPTQTYTVVYNANGGSGTTQSTTCTVGETCRLATNGFSRLATPPLFFGGWATTSGGTRAYEQGQLVQSLTNTPGITITLHAVWVDRQRVTYDPQGGTMTTFSNSTNTSGRLGSAPTVWRSGFTLNGWFTQPNGGGVRIVFNNIAPGTVFPTSTIIYAHWE